MDVAVEAALQVTPGTTRDELDWWIHQRVAGTPMLADRVVDGAGRVVTTASWFTPENVSLLLLPAASPWLAPGWVSYHGTLGRDNVLAAVLCQWGAELVACWDTMLQLTVARPPSPGDEAWTLAGQIKSLAGSLDINRWELAVMLPGASALFLHDRP